MGWCNNHGRCNTTGWTAGTTKWDGCQWCNVMGWTAGKNKWDGWCNIETPVQRDERLKTNEMVQLGATVMAGAARWDGQSAQRNGMDGATSEGWCNEMGWTAGTTKWDGWCNIKILLQRDGTDSWHDEMGWMVQHRNSVATR